MKALCDFHGLSQIVREPTREQNLLYLAICDLVGATATVLPKIADHKGVRVDVPMTVINEVGISRTVWHLKSADWDKLEKNWVKSIGVFLAAAQQKTPSITSWTCFGQYW